MLCGEASASAAIYVITAVPVPVSSASVVDGLEANEGVASFSAPTVTAMVAVAVVVPSEAPTSIVYTCVPAS